MRFSRHVLPNEARPSKIAHGSDALCRVNQLSRTPPSDHRVCGAAPFALGRLRLLADRGSVGGKARQSKDGMRKCRLTPEPTPDVLPLAAPTNAGANACGTRAQMRGRTAAQQATSRFAGTESRGFRRARPRAISPPHPGTPRPNPAPEAPTPSPPGSLSAYGIDVSDPNCSHARERRSTHYEWACSRLRHRVPQRGRAHLWSDRTGPRWRPGGPRRAL